MVQSLRLREETETTVILINCAPLQNRNFSLSKEFVTGGSDFFPLKGTATLIISMFNQKELYEP